jgi:light-regulated signal transduction histidine kinase (bacteriophytochrome)
MRNPASEIESQLKSLEETQRAILNILEDTEDEKNLLGNTQKAVINILEDYSEEKKSAEDTQRAVINILEDYSIEKASVEKMNVKLTSSNKEIEQFAYIASHDLQEPLRTISNYTGLFQKRFKGKLGEEADKHLEFIAGATRRMQSLIRDLLDYSRIEADKNKTAVDCTSLIADITSDMTVLITESKAVISAKQLPVVNGYLSGLKSLFQNLITNAIKFREEGTCPVVTITAQAKDKEWLFAVKDNGIGIDKQYYKKLFIIFQRLHNKDQYSGTGIGLAQCKKIVDLHGGKIWVESEPGSGSTFYFTIPK